MVIVALYGGCRLLEADVVEPSKGSTADVFDRVVWDQELFLHADGEGQQQHPPPRPGPPIGHQVAGRLPHRRVQPGGALPPSL